MELWDLYNENREKLRETMARGIPVSPGTYHLVVHVCIFHPDGRLLIQHRQPFKSGWSDFWDLTVGGSAVAGETSRQAAEREVGEEIGFPLDLTGVRPVLTVNFPQGFDDFYLVCKAPDITALRLQAEEVREVRWAALPEILSMRKSGIFIPYQPDFLKLLFALSENAALFTAPDTSVPCPD